jgi:hypothetical protein
MIITKLKLAHVIALAAAAMVTVVAIAVAASGGSQASTGVPVRQAAPVPHPSDKQLVAWWDDLEKGDAEASWALLKLSARPNEAVAFLAKKMRPLKIDAERVKELLAQLASKDEAIWKKAFVELEYFDARLAIDLETLMNTVTAAPARQRMVEVLSGRKAETLAGKEVHLRPLGNGDGYNFFVQDGGSWWAEHRVARINLTGWGNTRPKWTQSVRAIILLEYIATPESLAILNAMAQGHPEAQPTKAAKIAARQLIHKAAPLALPANELAALWNDLASPNYETANRAWQKLGGAGDNAMGMLREQIRTIAVPAVDMKKIEQLLADLNAEKFATREQAGKKLLDFGELAIIPIKGELEKSPSLEVRRRIELLLKKIGERPTTPDRQRVLDAIELLERVGTAKAHALIEEIVRDSLIPQIREHAQEAMKRIR